jgi:hypothetical protein
MCSAATTQGEKVLVFTPKKCLNGFTLGKKKEQRHPYIHRE